MDIHPREHGCAPNRTIVELKLLTRLYLGIFPGPPNRTIVELKYINKQDMRELIKTPNRTIVELK